MSTAEQTQAPTPSQASTVTPSAAAPPSRLPRRMRRILALEDLEDAARRYMPRPVFGFVSGAAETNASLRDNRAVFDEWGFRPRTLIDVSHRTTRTTLFGRDCAAPFGLAPMGASALAAYRGDLVLATAAERAGVPMIMSGSSLIRLEEVVAAAPNAWFQAYLPGEPERIAALVDRAATAGFKTLLLTVDVAVLANRENNVRNGFSQPLRPSLRLAWDGMIRPGWAFNTFLRTLLRHGMPHFENSFATRGEPIMSASVVRSFGRRDHLNWEHLRQIRKQWSGRLVVKGVLTADDARLAREAGVDGVIVSNHGGRQLDGAITPMRALPEVADVSGDMTVMIDSGFRRGTDVLKALALGARFVFVGRPFLYAAAIGGEAGVLHAIDLLKLEIDRDMALLGINSVSEMGPDRLMRIGGRA